MKLPLVSVIIPNYNYAAYLPQAIDSVLAQTYSEAEIIVVDDGSTDDSEEILRSYGECIRWIRQPNQGVASARNRGVLESNGELVAFLDADDSWLPLKLQQQVQRILTDEGVGLVHCGVEEIDDTGMTLRVRLEGMEGWVAREMLLFRCAVILGGGSGLLLSRRLFDIVGGFDTRLSTSADWDFFYRVAALQRVGFVPEVLVKYRIHRSSMHANVDAMEHDMLIGYEKAFSSNDTELRHMRRQCYGNLHAVLARSFFKAGNRRGFARHALKSLCFTPWNLMRVLKLPRRRSADVPADIRT